MFNEDASFARQVQLNRLKRLAKDKIKKIGYNSDEELLIDLTVMGEVNKSQNSWSEVTDVGDIRTDRVYMNKAQAKYYGLDIIEPE